MFESQEHLHEGKWSLTSLDCSLELVQFISDIVQYDYEKRPFADTVVNHPYFGVDVYRSTTIREMLPSISKASLACYPSEKIEEL